MKLTERSGLNAWIVVVSLVAAPFIATAADTVEERFEGTNLIVEPHMEFGQAVLRLTGPGGYDREETYLPGAPVTLDLAPAESPLQLASLPDGRYQYELALDPMKQDARVFRSLFYVEDGAVVPREEKRVQLASVREVLATERQRSSSETGAQGYQVQDYIDIYDYDLSGYSYINFESDYPAADRWWRVINRFGDLMIEDDSDLFPPGTPRVTVKRNGDLGLGTSSPVTALHLQRDNGAASLRVEESQSPPKSRILFELRNNGGPFFIFRNTDTNNSFSFAESAGTFIISHQQTPGIQFRIRQNGNLEISGALTQGSSRDVKEVFETLDGKEVLKRVSELPIPRWRYKSDPEHVRHVGPVAEDFHEMFGLGANDKGIAVSDTSGIALVAIQGLNERLQEKESELDALRAEVAALRETVQTLAKASAPDGG